MKKLVIVLLAVTSLAICFMAGRFYNWSQQNSSPSTTSEVAVIPSDMVPVDVLPASEMVADTNELKARITGITFGGGRK